MTKKSCAFCAIARGETEAFRVFEDELCVAAAGFRLSVSVPVRP